MNRFSTAIISGIMAVGLTGGPVSTFADDPPGLSLARELNDAFVAVADKVTPSVVVIEVTEKPTTLFGRRTRLEKGEGSGIIITADGYILTNNHVVDNAATNGITVQLQNGLEFPGVVVGTDPKSDIAVVKINPKGAKLTVAKLGDSSKLRVGEFVIAIGHPLDLTFSVTSGHVSALQRIVPRDANDPPAGDDPEPDYIQTDAVILPGNSGGPLINLDGEVIGINDMIEAYSDRFTGQTVNVGIGLAIPVNLAKAVKDILISRGKFVRSRIGILMASTQNPAGYLSLGLKPVVNRPSGIEVADVISGGPAARSGLKMGDIIVAVDDTPVNTTRGLYDEIAFKNPGQTIAVSILRNDKPFSIKVKTEAAPEEVAASIPDAAPSLTVAEMNYGFTVVDLTKDLANKFGVTATSGLIVTAAQRGSKLAVGDVITQFNGKPVPNAKAFIAALGALKPGQSWTMSLAPKGNEDPPFRVMRAPNE